MAVHGELVTWQDAEDAMIEAFDLLGALPDREEAWLAPGKGRNCSNWPAIVREVRAGDYGDGQGMSAQRPVRRRIGVAEVAVLDRMLLGPEALALAIPEQHRALVGRVIAMKRWNAGGFHWEDVRSAVVKANPGVRVPAGDALRMRYDRAIAKLAGAMTRRVLAERRELSRAGA